MLAQDHFVVTVKAWILGKKHWQMPKNLVIVVSYTKAKPIEGYLGVDYNVITQYRQLSHVDRFFA
jgi:hypothetical protein